MTPPRYSLEAVSPGKWRVKVSTGERMPSGSYRQKSRTFHARTKREAKERAADWAAIVRSESDAGTFRSLAEAWYAAKMASNKPSTMRGYRAKLDVHVLPTLGPVALIDMDRATMAAFQDQLAGAPRTRNHVVAIVRAVVRWGHLRGRISHVDFLAPLDTTTSGLERTQAPTADALRALLRHLAGPEGDPMILVIVVLAATTGARRGEILGLQVGDVNLQVGSIRIERSLDRTGPGTPKTEMSRRTVALPAETVAILARYLDGLRRFFAVAVGDAGYVLDAGQWLFPSPARPETHWYPEAVSKAVARHVVAAGLPAGAVRLHRLRNFSITALGDAGVPSKAIADRHGHAHLTITEGTYMGKLTEQDLLAAAVMGRVVGELMGTTSGVESTPRMLYFPENGGSPRP